MSMGYPAQKIPVWAAFAFLSFFIFFTCLFSLLTFLVAWILDDGKQLQLGEHMSGGKIELPK